MNDRQKKTDRRTEAGLYLGFVLLSVFLLMGGRAPQIFPEEAGYLGWANKLAHGVGSGFYFLPGYSLLLVPLMAVFRDIATVYPLLLIENALLNALTVVAVYRLARRWGGASIRRAAAVSAVICLYAPFVLYAQKAICEPLIYAATAFLLLAVDRYFETRSKKSLTLCVLLSAVLLLTHSRELVLIGVWAIFLPICFPNKKRNLILLAVLAVCAAAAAVWVLADPGTAAVHLREQVLGLLSLRGIGKFLITLLTQSCYWSLSTVGLAPIGIVYGIGKIRRRERGWQAMLFALLLFGATALLSALYMSHQSKAVQLVYGRYNDGALMALLLLGMLCYGKERPKKRVFVLCAAIVAATAILFGDRLRGLSGDIMNAMGLYFHKLVLWEFDLLIVLLFVAAIGAVFWGLRAKHGRIGILLLGALMLAHLGYTANGLLVTREQPPKLLRVYEKLDKKDLTLFTHETYLREFYRDSVYLPALALSETEGEVEMSKSLREGGAMIGAENGTFLWARSAAAQERYRDLILPWDGTISEFSAAWELLSYRDGTLRFAVENTGSPWLCLSAIRDVSKAVRIAVRYYDRQDGLIGEERLDFSDSMLHGDREEFSVSVADGTETVRLCAVREFVGCAPQGLAVTADGAAEFAAEEDYKSVCPAQLISAHEKQGQPDRNNLEGCYENWTGKESAFCNIRLECEGCSELLIRTEAAFSEAPRVRVTLNRSVELGEGVRTEEGYLFPLNGFGGTVDRVDIITDATNPFEQSGLPKWMSFLSLDSHIRPVQWAVHGIRKCFGTEVNNHWFGIPIERISVR